MEKVLINKEACVSVNPIIGRTGQGDTGENLASARDMGRVCDHKISELIARQGSRNLVTTFVF